MTSPALTQPDWVPRSVRLAAAEAGPSLRPWITFSLMVVLAFFGLILTRTSLDRSAFVLDKLEDQIARQEAQHWDLRVELARLQSPERIAAEANDLGLVFPASRVALTVDPVTDEALDREYRWAQLKALLSAQP